MRRGLSRIRTFSRITKGPLMLPIVLYRSLGATEYEGSRGSDMAAEAGGCPWRILRLFERGQFAGLALNAEFVLRKGLVLRTKQCRSLVACSDVLELEVHDCEAFQALGAFRPPAIHP